MSSQQWHDINDPGFWRKPDKDKPAPESNKPPDAADDPPPEPQKPLVKLSEGKFVPPAEGAKINKKCPVQVNVEYLDDSAKSMQKVTFSLHANYQDAVSNLSHYVDGFEKNGIAQAEMTMYPPPEYKEGDSVDYFFKAEHIRGEKIIDSEDLTLPMETQSIILQKGDYDENGAQKYNKEQSGDNFKPNNAVKKLQGNLITTSFLPKGSDDGFFGDQTDKAVKDFQGYAIKLVRMKRSLGKTENTDEGLNQQSPDGIVGEKTRDELDKWLSKDWIKPIPTLRHGEYDDTGVQNGKGKKGTDDHHQGTPVVEAQQNLQKVEASTDAAIDGWFYDKMLDAVKLFQDAAEKGEFIMNGVLTVIGENLTGHQKGEVDAKTQEYLKKVVDKTGTVPKPERPKWLEIAEQEAKRWAGKTEKEISKSFNYHKEVGISLSDLVGTDHAWCASFVNYCLKKANYAAFSPACRAKAIATDENFVKVEKPFTGCIALIGTHHVGFAYAVHTTKKVPILLGGNQSDQINFTAFSESITYFLPKDFKKPDKIPDLSLATTTELNAKFGIALNIKGGDVTR